MFLSEIVTNRKTKSTRNALLNAHSLIITPPPFQPPKPLNLDSIFIYLFISSSYIRGTKLTKKKIHLYINIRERERKRVDRTGKNIYTHRKY